MNCDSPFVVWLTAFDFWQVEIEDLKTRLPVWSLHSPLQVLASPLQTFRSCVFNWLTSLLPLSWQCQCQQGLQNPTQSLQWMRQMWTGRIHPGEASKGQGLWQTWNVSFKSWGLHAMGTYTSCHRMAPMYPSVCGKNKLVLLEKLWGAPLYCMKKSWCNGLIACKLGRAGVFLFAHVNCLKAAWNSFFTSTNCNTINTVWLAWLRVKYLHARPNDVAAIAKECLKLPPLAADPCNMVW